MSGMRTSEKVSDGCWLFASSKKQNRWATRKCGSTRFSASPKRCASTSLSASSASQLTIQTRCHKSSIGNLLFECREVFDQIDHFLHGHRLLQPGRHRRQLLLCPIGNVALLVFRHDSVDSS